MTVTVQIRYVIDPFQRDAFELRAGLEQHHSALWR
jgi:hypothetical protein